MDWFTGIMSYFMIYWVALFVVLPWNLDKKTIKPEEGITGAPSDPQLKKKFIATGVLSAVIWLIIFALIEIEIINFRDMAINLEGIE